jgi:hypothetical protein
LSFIVLQEFGDSARARKLYEQESDDDDDDEIEPNPKLEQGNFLCLCFVHPIFSSFGFWYFGHFSCVIFFPGFSVLPILP